MSGAASMLNLGIMADTGRMRMPIALEPFLALGGHGVATSDAIQQRVKRFDCELTRRSKFKCVSSCLEKRAMAQSPPKCSGTGAKIAPDTAGTQAPHNERMDCNSDVPVEISSTSDASDEFRTDTAVGANRDSHRQLGSTSKGSIGHPHSCAGACRYVKRKGGCRDGGNCSQCHLCYWKRREAKAVMPDGDLSVLKWSCSVRLPPQKLQDATESYVFPNLPMPSSLPHKPACGVRPSSAVSLPLQVLIPAPSPPPGLGFDVGNFAAAPSRVEPDTAIFSSFNTDDSTSSRSESEFAVESDASTTSPVDLPLLLPQPKAVSAPKSTESSLTVEMKNGENVPYSSSYIPGSIFRSMVQM